MFRKQNLDCVDTSVKLSLILRLKEVVSEIVMKYTAESVPLKTDEATNMLCCVLEAIFVHGLKSPKSLFSSRRENYSFSFYDFLLLFSHREIIEEIQKLRFVHTHVGCSRAWLRLTLNENSLISYLELMFRNSSDVKRFYNPQAFLRDPEKFDILKNILVSLENCKFKLVVDNSLLNQWTSGTLSLCGLWVDDNNIAQGIDVARNMDSKDLQAIPQLDKPKTPEPQFMAALRRQPLLAEEDALRIIMASKPSTSNATLSGLGDQIQLGTKKDEASLVSKKILHVVEPKPIVKPPSMAPIEIKPKNIPDPDQSPSTSVQQDQPVAEHPTTIPLPAPQEMISEVVSEEIPDSNLLCSSKSESEATNEELSYMDILSAYNKDKKLGIEIYSGSPMESHLTDIMETSKDNDTGLSETTSSIELNRKALLGDGFEIISTFSSNKQSPDMYPKITTFIGKIANEIGMDVQQYSCKFCRAPIGMSFATARVCHFTGNYFCTSCHQQDMSVIPSRVLLNWDFSLYSVCRLSHEFLEEIKDQPLFDLEQINPKLYSCIDELAELRDLRIKLNYVSIYLKTCKDSNVLEEFKKEIWPRDHLFEKVHLYSLSDLLSITNRMLTTPLTKLLKFGKSHIISCKICKAKGFVCEICKNPEVIFPFDLESIFKCLFCGAVYHGKCMMPGNARPCPRCQRWKTNVLDDEFCDDNSSN